MESSQTEEILTSEEPATDGGHDDLETQESTHSVEHIAVLLVDSVDADDVND